MANQTKERESDQAMEDAICLILRGCTLARELELNVSNLASTNRQPDMLAKSCDDVISIFSAAKERLSTICSQERPSSMQRDAGWLRSTCTQAMEMAQMQIRSASPMDIPWLLQQAPGQKVGGGLQWREVMTTGPAPPPITPEDFGKQIGMGSQKPRRRKDDMERRTMRVPAPRIGNTELPPDDGFTWRKYGQKEILGSRFPRGYFRCTHQKLYQCPAKKHVQRLDDDPSIFEVTYRGDHTCHMSSTAPSVPPPPMDIGGQHITQIITTTQFPTPSASLGRWLSMDFSASGSGSGGGGGSAGPSTVRYGKEVDQFPVLDMADAMFNAGSSSSNSMDSIFPASMAEEHHQKWEKDGKKN